MSSTHKPHVRDNGALGPANLGSQAHSIPVSRMLSFLYPRPAPQASVPAPLAIGSP